MAPPASVRPEPLRGCDPGSFAEDTVKVRLKEICQRTLAENDFTPEVVMRMQDLCDDLPYGQIRMINDPEAPDRQDWLIFTKPYLGQSWLEVPWFFAETYFYRRILEACGYFSSGEGRGKDPYTYQKNLAYSQFGASIQAACMLEGQNLERVQADPKNAFDLLADAIKLSLWGNQADLSMWPVGQADRPDRSHTGIENRDSFLVIDEVQTLRDYLSLSAPVYVDIVLDNSGMELVNDLLLADFLLGARLAARVDLHAKSHPTFVSDATLADVEAAIEFLHESELPVVNQAGARLKAHLESGGLNLHSHLYWTSPLAFWDAPDEVWDMLKGSSLMISKGDANYRRFLGDRYWEFDLPAVEA